MSIPGFLAEATIYRSRIAYQAAWASGETAGSGFDRVIPMAPVGGEICNAFCEKTCESDIKSRTGCSQSCTAKDCNEYTRPCTGCSNPCPGGQICRGVCTATSKDPSNCGTCGNACPSGVSCLNGTCGCPLGTTPCSGGCTNTKSDPHNCGGCGIACGAGQTCAGGACVPGCLVSCLDWNRCSQMCGTWPPTSVDAAQCWIGCLKPSVDCLNSTCG